MLQPSTSKVPWSVSFGKCGPLLLSCWLYHSNPTILTLVLSPSLAVPLGGIDGHGCFQYPTNEDLILCVAYNIHPGNSCATADATAQLAQQ